MGREHFHTQRQQRLGIDGLTSGLEVCKIRRSLGIALGTSFLFLIFLFAFVMVESQI